MDIDLPNEDLEDTGHMEPYKLEFVNAVDLSNNVMANAWTPYATTCQTNQDCELDQGCLLTVMTNGTLCEDILYFSRTRDITFISSVRL